MVEGEKTRTQRVDEEQSRNHVTFTRKYTPTPTNGDSRSGPHETWRAVTSRMRVPWVALQDGGSFAPSWKLYLHSPVLSDARFGECEVEHRLLLLFTQSFPLSQRPRHLSVNEHGKSMSYCVFVCDSLLCANVFAQRT